MSNLEKYRGIIPAFYACYDEDGEVSPERTRAFTQHLIDKGVKGLYVGGSSGECIYQTTEERKLILEHVMAVAKGQITIIAHVAAPSTRESVALAKHAAALGVDAIAAIPPIYFVLSEEALQAYWQAIIDAADIDFIIYNIPGTTQYSLSKSLFHKMLADPRVIGVKNSSMPVQDIITWKMEADRDIVIFNGPDEQFVGGLMMGATAGIGGTYAVMPELFLAAEKFVQAGQNKEALEVQMAIDDMIFTTVSGAPHLYSIFKNVLQAQGMNIGEAREPLRNVQTEEDEALVAVVREKIEVAVAKFC